MHNKLTGITRLIRATRVSYHGLINTYRNEEAFRLEVWACVILLPVALWQGETAIEQVLLVSSLFLILIVELLNTGIEAAIDRISSDYHPLSKTAKDVGSAAVHIAILQAILIWLLIGFKIFN